MTNWEDIFAIYITDDSQEKMFKGPEKDNLQ